MLRLMCKSKIHRATLTKVDLHYEGSIGIDSLILKAADIYPGEIVQVVNINNAARFETYAIEEKAGSGTIGLYGAAAHLGNAGDLVIILSYGFVEDKKACHLKLKPVYVDSNNKIVKQPCKT
ncbi:MAG: aspartate 1-decarboxylase [Candidatus Omnitrophica bacterium]|nr:aspartate 1-decarboxylase [Candidatus Omnitrophota bacterium]